MTDWWKSFFDADYIRLWRGGDDPSQTAQQANGIWDLLELHEGSRVLDAPCGYGRLSLPLALRGADVLGVDLSDTLLAQAEADRPPLLTGRLRYLRHDIREPLPPRSFGFDAALNIFSSFGYSTEADDLAIFRTLQAALRPGGRLLIECMHRDAAAALFSRGLRPSHTLPDGTTVDEEPTFDPVSGRVNSTWRWFGPAGQGTKSASFRIYNITEILRLLDSAGLRFVSAHRGCSREPFDANGPGIAEHVGILAERP